MRSDPLLLRRLWPHLHAVSVRSTPLVGPVTRRASRAFGHRAVPARWATSSTAYAEQEPSAGVAVEVVEPPHTLRPWSIDGRPESFQRAFEGEPLWSIPERLVVQVPGGRSLGSLGSIISADNTLLYDVSPAHNAPVPERHPIFRRLRLPPVERVDGTVCVLAARASHNYYHFLLDVIPRLELLRRAGALQSDVRFYVDNALFFQQQLLEAFGVPSERIIPTRRFPHIRADLLVAPSLPGGARMDPRWALDFLRDRLVPVGAAPCERIYVSRGSERYTRCVVNEDEVMDLLRPLGFRLVVNHEMSVTEQAALYARSEVVVAPHGAGMANIAFCPPGARVVEIFSPRWLNLAYPKMAAQLDDVRYFYAIGAGEPPADFKQYDVARDIVVEIPVLAEVLQLAEVGPPAGAGGRPDLMR